jgi:transposase
MFSKQISYIGIDIAKLKFDVCFHNGDYASCIFDSFSNDLDGFFDFFSFLESINHLKNIRIGIEATSTYMIPLQKYLDSHKIKYIIINPKKIHHYIKYKNFESKTDKLDSYYISDYITNLDDAKFNSTFQSTRYIYKPYKSYLNLITKTETHIKGLKDSIIKDEFISDTLKTEILQFNEHLRKTKSKATKELLEVIKIAMPEYDHIKSDLVGVGDKTLIAVLPLIYDISDKYSVKQLQSYIGLNVVYKDSGSSVNKKQMISKSGNDEARKMLYLSAVASISSRSNNYILKEKYNRLVQKGKPKKVALVALSAHIFRAIVYKLNYYKGLRSDKN